MEQQLTTQQLEVANQKKESWGKFGLGIYTKELVLIAKADKERDNLSVMPADIFEVPDAEKRLSEGKKVQKEIEADRKAITAKLDELTKRLMEPEKSLTDPINTLAAEIIKLKKADEKKQKDEKDAADELVRCKEFCQNEAIKIDSRFKNIVLELVARCYNNALNADVKPENLKDYLATSKAGVTAKIFTYELPVFHNAHIKHEQVIATSKEFFKVPAADTYVADFAKQIDEKFSDYDVAFHNKIQALSNAQAEAEAKKKEIDQQAQQQAVSNKIEASAMVSTPATFFTKALKKSYAIDMDETMENALAIIAAFSANMHLCLKHIKVSKWFGFSATQAGNALAKVKSEDNAFAPTGIIFKEVEKL